MDERIKKKIVKRLYEIESEHNVEILLAVESGSRAWGFESTDSDYDVRFIYRHPFSSYVEVFPHRDVIEYPIVDEFDYSGWDLVKALGLLNKSNPVLFEWFNSPILYIKNDVFFDKFLDISKKYYSKISATYHYLQMAKGNYRQYLKNDLVSIKKYFYVLRPVLCCMWIEESDVSPPMEFSDLLTLVNSNRELVKAVNGLLKKKKSGVEMGKEKKIPEINSFLEEKIEYFKERVKDYKNNDKPHRDYLNEQFRELLRI